MKSLKTLSTAVLAFALISGASSAQAQCSSSSKTSDATVKTTHAKYTEKQTMKEQPLIETAVAAGQFNTLVAAVQAAGLVETLSGDGPFTVFAPTDAAFAKLPEGTVDALLKDKAKLASILTYHVVAGAVTATDVTKLSSAKTVNGESISIAANGKGVLIDGAKVTTADVLCSNGVIHVIDEVLLPN